MQRLSLKQQAFLDYVMGYLSVNGYSPSAAECCEHFNWSSYNSAHEKYSQLKQKGYLENKTHEKRSYKPTAALMRKYKFSYETELKERGRIKGILINMKGKVDKFDTMSEALAYNKALDDAILKISA